MMKSIAFAVLSLALAADAYGCNICGNFTNCRYRHLRVPVVVAKPAVVVQKAAVVEEVIPAVDKSFNVQYNINFPTPQIPGSTVYLGQSYGQYQALDPSAYLNAASRYLDRSQDLSARAASEFSQSANVILQGQASIAELQQRTELLKVLGQVVAATGPSQSQRVIVTAERDATGALRLSHSPDLATASVPEIVRAKCLTCHSGAAPKGGLNLTDLSQVDKSFEAKILDRITSADPARRMPQNGTLTAGEIAAFFKASSICGPAAKPVEEKKP